MRQFRDNNPGLACGREAPVRSPRRRTTIQAGLLITVRMLASTAILVQSGCEQRTPVASASPTTGDVDRTYSSGDATTGSPAALTIHLTLDKDHITTVDRAILNVQAVTAPNVTLDWTPPKEQLGEWQVASTAARERANADGARTVEHVILLEPFLEGTKTVPALTFRYRTGETGAWRTLSTDPIEVTVSSVMAADSKEVMLAPAKPPTPVLIGAGWQRWVIVGGAGGLALAYPLAFVAAHVRARRRGKSIDPVLTAQTGLAVLRRELEADRAAVRSPEPRQGAQLAMIARAYLSVLTRRDVRGLLADEIMPAVRARFIGYPHVDAVIGVLRTLDQQRFSPLAPSTSELLGHVDVVEALVEQTRVLINTSESPIAVSAQEVAA